MITAGSLGTGKVKYWEPSYSLTMAFSVNLLPSILLLLIEERRPADALPLEVEIYLNMVGDGHERNALVHPIVLTVKDHFPLNLARACPLARNY